MGENVPAPKVGFDLLHVIIDSRVATFILVPGVLPHQASIEMISVTSAALSDALLIDASALH